MSTKQRPVDRGRERGREAIASIGREIRLARTSRDLGLREVGRAVGLSASVVSRVERGLVDSVALLTLSELAAVVGLDLSTRAYPGGPPIRDAAHAALLDDLRARLHRSLTWETEVPLPITRDQRAWDALIRGDGWRVAVEAETRPRDAQALERRLRLKVRDGAVDALVLLLRGSRWTRDFLASSGDRLRAFLPLSGERALLLLAAGAPLPSGAIVVLPPRSRSRTQPRSSRRDDSRLAGPQS